jgi:hypothetical protein
MNHRAQFVSKEFAPSRLRSRAIRRRTQGLSPVIEGLENRVVLSTIQWNTTAAPTGGLWDTPGNWVGDKVPGSSDTAVIDLTKTGTVTTGPSDSALILQTNSSTTVSVSNGTLSLGAGSSTINGPITVSTSGTLALSGTTLLGSGTVTDAGQLTTSVASSTALSIAMTSGSSLQVSNFTVQSGGALNVGATASVTIGPASSGTVTLTDDGTLSFAANDTVTLNDSGYYLGAQIVVGSGGLLQATSTTFDATSANTTNGGNYTQVAVNAGGHLKASNSSFEIGSVNLADSAVFNAGDLSGNAFDTTLVIPAVDVQYLSGAGNNNLRFQSIDLQPDTVLSGQAVALNAIGTQTTAHLNYVLPGGFTVALGGSVSVGAGVPVTIGPASSGTATVTDDGTLSFAANDTATLNDNGYYLGAQIVVGSGGLLQATSTTFDATNANNTNGGNYTQVAINAGGHLKASGSSFEIGSVSLADNVVFNAGDLAGNAFDTTLVIPAVDVQYLSGTGNNNLRFQNIDLQPDTVASGEAVALNAIGTQTTTNLHYVMPSGLTIGLGGSVSVGAGVPVTIGPASSGTVTLTDDGTLSFAANDTATLNDNGYYLGAQIVVGSGGLLQATSTTFDATNANTTNGGNYTQVAINAGGHLKASGSSFEIGSVSLADNVVFNAGDLAGNAFDTPLYIPAVDVQYLSGTGNNNLRFQNVDLQPDTVLSGQAVDLNAIGTQTTAHLNYVLPGGLTINQGGTMLVGPGVPVTIGPASSGTATVTDDGTLSFAPNDAVTLNDNGYYLGAQIVVGSGGVLQATGTAFDATNANNTNGGNYTQIVVNSGGQFTAFLSTFAVGSLNLNSNSSDTIQSNVLATELAINSGALSNIIDNDFTNGTVAASGPSSATITLTDNYWGTTNPTQIAAKITSSGPTVSYTPFLSAPPPPGAGTTIVASSTPGTYNANSSQSVTLTASLTSGNTKPNAGTVTFILTNGVTIIGNPVTASVNSSGVATTNILLPAGTLGGTYSILAIYNGTATYLGSIDASHTVTVNPATATTTAANATDTFSAVAAQTVGLSATVTSSGGTVNEGTETFTVLAGSTPVGSPVTVNVVNGAASASYSVPAGTNAGTYTIDAVYNGTADFKSASDTAHTLTISAAATTTASVNTTTTYNASSRTVPLTATVTSAAGTVNQATVTFTILSGSTTIGSPVSVSVANGSASANYTLPAGLTGGTYTIKAAYAGGQDFQTSSDSSHTLTVGAAATTTAAASVTTTFSSSAQTVTLTATVTSPAGTVGEGSETFTVLNGTTVIGTATTGNVVGGAVSVNYTIPANTPVGTYTIKAVYNGTVDYMTATDTAHGLTIGSATAIVTPAIAAAGAASPTGSVVAGVSQDAQPSDAGTTVDVAGVTSTSHKRHRLGSAINRGPLSLGRAAAHRRSGHHTTVADRRIEPAVRPGQRG